MKYILLSVAAIVTSCGFVSDEPPANSEVYKSDEIQSCKIDITQLSQMFKTNQTNQILCLQDNFIKYTKYVHTKDSKLITEVELGDFVREIYPDQSESIIKATNILFQLNMLLLRDERGMIATRNVAPLFEFLIKLNQEAVIVNQVIREMNSARSQEKFWEYRENFNASITRFAEETTRIIEKSQGSNQALNIKRFIFDIIKDLGAKEINSDVIDSFIFSKKILLNGEKETLTSDEFKLIVARLPKILTLYFDFSYAKDSNFNTDEEYARFKLNNARKLYNIIQFNQQDFRLFSVEQMLLSISSLTKSKNANKFKESVSSLKTKIIGGNQESFSLSDARNALDIFLDYSEKNYFNIVTYDGHNEILKKDDAILSLDLLDLPDKYDLFSHDRITALHWDFQDTAINTRYFRDEKEGVPYIGNEIRRNKYGFLQSALTTFFTNHLLKGYGHKNPQGRTQLSAAEFKLFLDQMEPVLKEFNLWPNDKIFAQNAILMSDLFQTNSNGNLEANSTEATEYAQLVMSSTQLSAKFSNVLSSVCDIGINSKEPIFETQCYNENYFTIILNELNYKIFFPNLNKYISAIPPLEVEEYLKGIEGFARKNPSPENPIDKHDSNLIIGSMLNIESTFLRFDTNGDNVIDYDELDKAFNVYRNTIIAIAKLEPSQEIYAKSVFLYMVTKLKPPPSGTWTKSARFYAYHKCVSSDVCRKVFLRKIEAKRLNIGKLLSYVAKSNNFKNFVEDENTSEDY